MLIQCTLNYIIIVHYPISKVAFWSGTITNDFRLVLPKNKKSIGIWSIILFYFSRAAGVALVKRAAHSECQLYDPLRPSSPSNSLVLVITGTFRTGMSGCAGMVSHQVHKVHTVHQVLLKKVYVAVSKT
jgi:hypothetical protein